MRNLCYRFEMTMFQVRKDFSGMELSHLEGSSIYMDDTWISTNVSVGEEDVLDMKPSQESARNNTEYPTSPPGSPEQGISLPQTSDWHPVHVTTSTPLSKTSGRQTTGYSKASGGSVMTKSCQSKNFMCEICEYSSDNKSNLKRHISSVHNKERHRCPECSKLYASKFDLKQHVLQTILTKNLCVNFVQICSTAILL